MPFFFARAEDDEPLSLFNPIESKATVIIFAHDSDHVVAGHESGRLTLFDAKSGEEVVTNKRAHREIVTDIQMSPDRSYFITSSKDKTSKVRARGVFGTSYGLWNSEKTFFLLSLFSSSKHEHLPN